MGRIPAAMDKTANIIDKYGQQIFYHNQNIVEKKAFCSDLEDFLLYVVLQS